MDNIQQIVICEALKTSLINSQLSMASGQCSVFGEKIVVFLEKLQLEKNIAKVPYSIQFPKNDQNMRPNMKPKCPIRTNILKKTVRKFCHTRLIASIVLQWNTSHIRTRIASILTSKSSSFGRKSINCSKDEKIIGKYLQYQFFFKLNKVIVVRALSW